MAPLVPHWLRLWYTSPKFSWTKDLFFEESKVPTYTLLLMSLAAIALSTNPIKINTFYRKRAAIFLEKTTACFFKDSFLEVKVNCLRIPFAIYLLILIKNSSQMKSRF